MTQQGTVRIWWDPAISAYRMVMPYNKGFLDLLKTLVPVSDRSYESETHIWTFTERFLKPVQELVEKAFGRATLVDKAQAEAAQQNKSTAPGAPLDAVIVEFFRLLPQEAARRAYLVASNVMHPDRGGDMEKMSKLNAAWTRLEKELWPKP